MLPLKLSWAMRAAGLHAWSGEQIGIAQGFGSSWALVLAITQGFGRYWTCVLGLLWGFPMAARVDTGGPQTCQKEPSLMSWKPVQTHTVLKC